MQILFLEKFLDFFVNIDLSFDILVVGASESVELNYLGNNQERLIEQLVNKHRTD